MSPIANIENKQLADHNDPALSIYTMVLYRLFFLEDTDKNKAIVSAFILQQMHFFQCCFLIPEEKIGIEVNYNVNQQSLLADLVALNIIFATAARTTARTGESGGSNAFNTFLKLAKAGSVEVEFGTFDIKKDAVLAFEGKFLFQSLRG